MGDVEGRNRIRLNNRTGQIDMVSRAVGLIFENATRSHSQWFRNTMNYSELIIDFVFVESVLFSDCPLRQYSEDLFQSLF